MLTWMPSSSLLMHQKLSASMFLRASSWRLDTSKFSTSSSGAEKGEQRERVRHKRCRGSETDERKLEVKLKKVEGDGERKMQRVI